MANYIENISNIESFIADIVQQITSFDADKVLISYRQKGQIFSTINENVVYVHIEQESSSESFDKNRTYIYNSENDKVLIRQDSFRTLRCQIVFYGAESDYYGNLLVESLSTEQIKSNLKVKELSLISNSIRVNKVHEKIGQQWWDRFDVEFNCYQPVRLETYVGYIEEVDYTILKQEG